MINMILFIFDKIYTYLDRWSSSSLNVLRCWDVLTATWISLPSCFVQIALENEQCINLKIDFSSCNIINSQWLTSYGTRHELFLQPELDMRAKIKNSLWDEKYLLITICGMEIDPNLFGIQFFSIYFYSIFLRRW